MTEFAWVLRNARLEDDQPLVDIALEGGKIAAIGPELVGQGLEEHDLKGRVVLPGLVEAHCHVDKNLTMERVGNASGTLTEAIQNWVAFKPKLTKPDYLERGARGLEMAIAAGTTALRTHVDVDASGLMALEAVLELKARYQDVLEIQIVALGGPGMGGAESDAMVTAITMGADIVGGCPAIRPDPKAEVIAALELASLFGKPVDLHVDENENPSSRSLETLAEETIKRGLEGRVTAGHCCSLDFMDQDTADRVMDKVAMARINIVTLPACNLNLQGRGMHPTPRGLTRVKELLARGVNVVIGSDNVQDPFHPVGNYDLLHAANIASMAAHMTSHAQMLETIQMVTTRPAQALGLENYGIQEGAKADLIVLDAQSKLASVTVLPTRLMVFKSGKLVSSTRITKTIMGREVSSWT
jgi:cytosine/creatinine deaminase